MKNIVALLCGLVFGIGLAVSGMTDTAKVLGFLDLFGNWVPDLAFVMGGAVCFTLVAFRFVLRREQPLLTPAFSLPTSTAIDRRLLGGAAIFGIGWGVYGYCPGPAISALVYLDSKTVIFVVAMLIGMALANRVGDS
ncbi:YeeE/YedE family protein [bacterium]|nr:YeeE/YedE family protein [bacterium]